MARKPKPRRRKPGSGTIRLKRGRDRPYEASFPLGKSRYRTRAFATYSEATAYLDALTAERDDAHRPRDIAGGSQSIRRFLSDWLAIKRPHIKRKTYQDYEYQCGVACRYLGQTRRIDSIRSASRRVMLAAMHSDGYQNTSQLRAVLCQAFEYAEEEDYIKRNPFRRARAPRVERKKPIVLSKAQRAHMLDTAAGDDLEALWHLYSRLGLRCGEGIGLLWANVDWDRKTISVTQQLTRIRAGMIQETPKTTRSRRTIPAPTDVLELLRAHQKRQREQARSDPDWQMTGLVFTREHGRPFTDAMIRDALARLRRRAGITANVTPHGLRHTAIHILEDSGTPLSVVQAFAGHTSATMTAHYTDHAGVEEIRAALEKVG